MTMYSKKAQRVMKIVFLFVSLAMIVSALAPALFLR